MDLKQIPDDVTRILIPDHAVTISNPDDLDNALYAARDDLADELASACDEDGPIEDFVFSALHHNQQRLRSIEKDRRHLLAYAREFAPRRYPMEALAPWAGMSASNIRKGKAYNDTDIHAVAKLLGRFPPGEPDDPEFAAMYAIQSMPEAQRVVLLDDADPASIKVRFTALDTAAARRVLDWSRAKYSTTMKEN